MPALPGVGRGNPFHELITFLSIALHGWSVSKIAYRPKNSYRWEELYDAYIE